MSRASLVACLATAFSLIVWFLGSTTASAGGPPWGVPSGVWPWNKPNYHGYKEPKRPTPPPRPAEPAAPSKYTVRVTVLPSDYAQEEGNRAYMMAHLPEDAEIWFFDTPTKQRGAMREFMSPPLSLGKSYTYTIRAAWVEDGRWVQQTHDFSIRPGDIHCIDLVKAGSAEEETAANLAQLSEEERMLAQAQKFCAVQDKNPLGSMGVPVRIMVKGQPVFVCCEGCTKKAKTDPEQTLAKALKGKN